MELKTPLYEKHLAAGGKMVPFAGYSMPVQYAGVIEEHMAVREKAGLFDASHMGEFLLSGPDALANLNRILTNDFTNLARGRVRYSLLLNDAGGALDDLIVYRLEESLWMIVVNASNRERDAAWIEAHLSGDTRFQDISDNTALIALQGPKSGDILKKLMNAQNIPVKYYSFTAKTEVVKRPCLVSRTGYTGEHGYELYCPSADAPALWDALLEAGKDEGLIPCGLGARDTLRLEAGMPLYGHELGEEITPLEAGLGFAVKLDKPDFIGKTGMLAKGEPETARVGIKITGRGIAREHNPIFINGERVGETTSGTHCPYLGGAYAMAYVKRGSAAVGTAVEIEVRGRSISGEIVALPFYTAKR